jgi:hypothetical protein
MAGALPRSGIDSRVLTSKCAHHMTEASTLIGTNLAM